MPFTSIGIKAPPHYRIRPMMLFALIDTGSPWIAITPMGASLLNIPSKSLSLAKYPQIVFAGYKFDRVSMEDVAFL
jgi:hypothetical protein